VSANQSGPLGASKSTPQPENPSAEIAGEVVGPRPMGGDPASTDPLLIELRHAPRPLLLR
jgi:hypothetical protein